MAINWTSILEVTHGNHGVIGDLETVKDETKTRSWVNIIVCLEAVTSTNLFAISLFLDSSKDVTGSSKIIPLFNSDN